MRASAIHGGCMNRLTEDDVREIQQIHSSWIEFWPPDAPPVLGRTAVSARLARGSTKIHGIEISARRILGSNEIAYLTASYKTTFSSAEDSIPRQAFGSHLWGLEKRAGCGIGISVSRSVWGLAAISGTRQPPPSASPRPTS